MIRSRLRLPIFIVVIPGAASAAVVRGQTGAVNGEWRSYGGDAGHTRYAPLSQIDATNFSTVTVAWRFKTDHLGPRPEFNFQSTPLMTTGVLYTTAVTRRAVAALDPPPEHCLIDGLPGRGTGKGAVGASASVPASACGSSTRSRRRVSSGTTRG